VGGLSHHQDGIALAPVAYMLGARVIEKHFTASHTAKGTDHAFSLAPEGMRKLVRDLRRVPAAIGNGVKRPLPSEEAPLRKMGKQLVAARPLPAGHALADGDLVAKSPDEGGFPPYRLDDLLGRRLLRPLEDEEAIRAEDIGEGIAGDVSSGSTKAAI
jgi:N-acetylneuraminate synthase/sialic acid synthase